MEAKAIASKGEHRVEIISLTKGEELPQSIRKFKDLKAAATSPSKGQWLSV
jgi:hypothetical protein